MANVAEEKVTPDDAVDMARELLPSRISSRELGLKLGLSKPMVEHIHRNLSEPQDRLFHVLIRSTSDSGSRPTWRAFGEALRSPEVGLPPALAEAIETAYSTSKPVEKVPHSAMADEEEVKSRPTLVESLKLRVKSLRQRFRSIRKSTIQTLEKCQVAVVTVVSLVTTILGFNVRNALQNKYHKDLHECKDHWELFGYLNLYWNYLSFNLLTELLDEHALKDCSHARNEMVLYTEDIERFMHETPLVLYSSAIIYPEFTPPGFQKMVTEHKFSESTTFESLEDFRKGFLDTFGLPDCVMMFYGTEIGSIRVTWFVLLPKTVIQHLKGSQGKIKAFRDFKVASVEIDQNRIFHIQDSKQEHTHSLAATEATMMSPTLTSPETEKDEIDDPYITWDVLLSSLLEDRGSMDSHVLHRQFQIHNIDSNVLFWSPRPRFYCGRDIHDMLFLFDELRDIPNGFQIFYRCLRETQDICRGHQILADDIEMGARKSIQPHLPALTQKPASEAPSLRPGLFSYPSGPTRISTDRDPVIKPGSSVGKTTESTREKPISFFSLCSEDSLVYSGDAFSYFSRTGVSFNFPAAMCPRPVTMSVEVIHDDYILPPGYEEMPIVSDMYKITASDELPVPVTLEIEHCALVEEEESLVYIVAHGPPPYRFNLLPGGHFSIGRTYGEIELKQFSIFAILAQKLGWRLSLSVQLFYHKDNAATFVATKNTQSLIRAVRREFADTVPGSSNSIVCDYTTEAITLTIPDESPARWTVVPDFDPPQILTRLIREYREGKTPPSIKLNMKWKGDGEPKEEELKIKVRGCSINSFTLFCKPSTTSCVSPHHQSPQQSLVHQPTVPPSPISLASSNLPSEPHTQREPHVSPEQPSANSLTISAESRAHQSLVHQPTTPQSPLSLASSNLPSEPHTPRESHVSPEQPSASSLSTMSPESRALRRSNTIFTRGVDPENLVTVLYSNFLLTPEEKARTMQQTLTVSQKLEEIFQIMERRVSTTPGNFHKMIQVLKAEPATKAVGEKIQGIYDEEYH